MTKKEIKMTLDDMANQPGVQELLDKIATEAIRNFFHIFSPNRTTAKAYVGWDEKDHATIEFKSSAKKIDYELALDYMEKRIEEMRK